MHPQQKATLLPMMLQVKNNPPLIKEEGRHNRRPFFVLKPLYMRGVKIYRFSMRTYWVAVDGDLYGMFHGCTTHTPSNGQWRTKKALHRAPFFAIALQANACIVVPVQLGHFP